MELNSHPVTDLTALLEHHIATHTKIIMQPQDMRYHGISLLLGKASNLTVPSGKKFS